MFVVVCVSVGERGRNAEGALWNVVWKSVGREERLERHEGVTVEKCRALFLVRHGNGYNGRVVCGQQ